jgi:hypothetical protein
MTITLGLLGIALLFALFLMRYAPSRSAAPQTDELHLALEPIYVPALMNLIDENNLDFLRRSLNASDFRKAQRERNRSLRVYVRRISNNTRILIAAAESARHAPDPAVAESARVLLETSLATRTRAVQALAFLYVGEIFPGFLPDLSDAISKYQSAAAGMSSLQSLTSSH